MAGLKIPIREAFRKSDQELQAKLYSNLMFLSTNEQAC